MENSWDKIGRFILIVWFLEFLVYLKFLFTQEEIPERTELIGKTISLIILVSLVITLIAL